MGRIATCVIGGWFGEPLLNPKPVVFWGRLKVSKSIVDGELLDKYGHSKINGKVDFKGLDFEKKYYGGNDVFEYNFEKRNGLWVGEYKHPNGMTYPATALTNLINESAFEAIGIKLNQEEYFFHPLSF